MDDSTGDSSKTLKDSSRTSDHFEGVLQENHELRKKIELIEKITFDQESELTFLNNDKIKLKSELQSLQKELDTEKNKNKKLESVIEEEKLYYQKAIKEAKESSKLNEVNTVIVPDQEQLNILTGQQENLEKQLEESQELLKTLMEEKMKLIHSNHKLECEVKLLQDELSDVKVNLEQKTSDLRHLNETLESTREEKLLLSTEIQMLKASDTNASRGNSLFAEVEENRLKIAAQREFLKLKYINLKKVLTQKQAENNKLKMEIIKIRREDKDDEKSIHRDYSTLIDTYKERISELEQRVKTLQQSSSHPPDAVSSDTSQINWVHTMVENARKETRSLQAEIEKRSSNYVIQGHQLFNSQKENRKLRAINQKLQSEIDELKVKLDVLKATAEANDEEVISPLAIELMKDQKQKTVKFTEEPPETITSTSLPHEDSNSCQKEEN